MKKFIISMVAGMAILTSGVVNAGTRAAFRVINESSETVVRIHVAPPSASRYGSTDLLGRSSLPPGYNIMVDPGLTADSNNECVLDVIGAEGSKWEKRFDVCVEPSWTLIGGKRKTIQ